jgi:outer membrane protein with glycine zipper
MEEFAMGYADRLPLRGITGAVLLVGGIAFLNGCESVERAFKDNPKTGVGAGAGGAGGAIIGGLAGATQGAVIGGLLGALAGGVIGQVLDRQDRNREATAESMAYTPAKGDVIRIEAVNLNPPTLRPGETLNVNVRYAVVTNNGTAPVHVREIRHLYYQGELVGNPVIDVERPDGTYWSTLPITLPASATPGRYQVEVAVETNGVLDRWESGFTVAQQ